VTPEVENSPDNGKIILKGVIHGIGESLRQEAVIAKDLWMDACVEDERVDVGEQGIKEILAEPLTLRLIEQTTRMEIVNG
jgi:hypothetical protein